MGSKRSIGEDLVNLFLISYGWVQKDHFVMPWVKWDMLAVPKLLGGWGLKNIHLFSKSLQPKWDGD
jgi:hypothetical protein